MQIATVGAYPLTIGSIIAVVVLILAVLGMAGVLPMSATVIFGLIAALAVARLS